MYYRTEIITPNGARSKLARKHGCSAQYAGRCLRFEAHSELADRIRKDAIASFHGKKIQIEVE